MGRPSTYSEEIAQEICDRLALGQSLYSICKDEHMPPEPTARGWMQAHKEFSANSTRAREMGCDRMAEECIEIADNTQLGIERTTKGDGSVETKEGDMLAHRKLRIETRMRLIGKWSKRYADKVQQEHSGSIGMTMNLTKPDEEL